MIYLGSDHAGFELKEEIKKYLVDLKYEVDDLGAHTLNQKDDYPKFAQAVAEKVVAEGARGILFCGSGIGVCVVANKVKGVRAGMGYSVYAAEAGRMDDDTNVLCLAGRVLKPDEAKDIVRTWLTTDFSGAERHVRRLQQVQKIENTK